MKNAAVLLNYPLQNQIDVGHIDLLKIQFENMLNVFDEVYVISPRDNRKYELDWDKRIKVCSNGCASKLTYYASPLSDLRALIRLIKGKDVKVIRALAHSSGFVAVLASKLTSVPAIVSIHCDRELVAKKEGESKFKHLLLNFADGWTYRNAAKVLVISKYIEKCVKNVSPSAKTVLHYNFVDTNLFKPIKHKNKVPVLIFSGRLTKVKGVDILLKAMPAVLKKKKVILKICGDGPERANLEKLSRKLGISKKVQFLGSLDHKTELPHELAMADIFVSPALSGFSLIEAMSCGLPIVAADVEWSKEIVNNKIGILVKYGSSEAIEKGILRLFSKLKSFKATRKSAIKYFSKKEWLHNERLSKKV